MAGNGRANFCIAACAAFCGAAAVHGASYRHWTKRRTVKCASRVLRACEDECKASLGPLVSEGQREKVVAQVDAAVADGARLVLGGSSPEGAGWYYPATVLADVSSEQRISHDETFGPVVSLSVFDGSEEEAVRLANDTPYGLGANVFTGDGERGARVAAQMHAGQVGINQYLGGAPGTPWVGARQSGFGFLGGLEGHRQFTWPKSVSRPV